MNYVERAAPASSHQLIIDCSTSPLYEPIKDFALNRQQRCDIWCRQPAPTTANLSELFGGFVYGITLARADVPKQMKSENGTINLNTPLYAKLVDLMTLMPLSIGDFLAHPDGKNYSHRRMSSAPFRFSSPAVLPDPCAAIIRVPRKRTSPSPGWPVRSTSISTRRR